MQQPRRRLQRASFTAYQLNSTTVCQPHRESKNKTLNSCPILLQMLTDFKNSFTDKLTDKFAITKKPYVNIPPHLRYIATLPCEIWKSGNWTCMKLHEFWTCAFEWSCSQRTNWTEVTCNKSTQLHDTLIGHARQRHDWTGCSETRAVGAQSVRMLWNTRTGMHVLRTRLFSSVHGLWTNLKASFTAEEPNLTPV